MSQEDVTLNIPINAEVSGTAQTKALSDAMESLAVSLSEVAKSAKTAATQAKSIAQSNAGIVKGSTAAASSINAVTAAIERQQKVASHSQIQNAIASDPSIATAHARGAAANIADPDGGKAATAYARQQASLIQLAAAQEKSDRAAQLANTHNAAQLSNLRAFNAAEETARGKITATNSAFNEAIKVTKEHTQTLGRAGYALNNVSFTLAIAGAALLAFNGLVIKAAADYQTAFAQISRTSGVSGQALTTLSNQFIELAQTIPVSFDQIAKIGVLAGQLNIPANNIVAFTRTVAEFSATTNVNAEDAATAFGRLDALLPDVKGNYDALGSAILDVGVNSVATESQIINTTSQIAAAGAQAGLSADKIIGLAASFASLGVAPEAARGTTIRVFSTITTAVNEGGDALKTFGKLSGLTAEQFKTAWSADAGGTFVKVLQGLQTEGSAAETTIRGLGITAVRDINSLLKLSQNVQLVSDNMGYANEGFTQGTQLATAFATQAATLASHFQELINTFQSLFATIGGSALKPLTGLVDAIEGVVKGAADLAKNPLAQSFAATIGIASSLVGILLILAAVAAKIGGNILIARVAITDLGAAAAKAGGGLKGLTTAMAGSAVGARILATAFATINFLAISAAIAVVADGIGKLQAHLEDNKTAAKDYFGNLQDLAGALKKDTEAAKEGGPVYEKLTSSYETSTKSTADWATQLENATGGQIQASDATQETTKSIQKQTLILGENARAWYANQVANDTDIQKLFQNSKELEKQGLNVTGFASALAKGDTASAQKIYEEFAAKAKKQLAQPLFGTVDPIGYKNLTDELNSVDAIMKAYAGSADQAASNTKLLQVVSDATGVSMATLTGATDDADVALDNTVSTLSQVQEAFANSNSIGQFANDFYTLIAAVEGGAQSFNEFDQSGEQNLQNLQATIASAIDSAQIMGVSASEAVAIVFQQLQQQGVNTAALLASLANMGIPGVNLGDVNSYVNGTKQLDAGGQKLQQSLNGVAKSAKKAQTSIGGVGGGSAAAAKQVYTLANYASDLGSVFDRAFSIRFSAGDALDKITTGWRTIADATADANKKMQEARTTLLQLASDKSVDEYFLGVANAYGDTLRASEIQADLAKNADDTASAQKDLADAQSASSKTLVGNSKAAVDNRATIEGLVKNYQDYIQALASSGADQATLSAKTAQLKQQFIQQATALGFSSAQVQTYADSFDDLTLAIQKVPRNITVSANMNPAQQAINEFLANNRNGKGASGGVSVPVKLGSAGDPVTLGFGIGMAVRSGIAAALSAHPLGFQILTAGQPVYNVPGTVLKLFKSGGYTGSGSSSAISGVTHGKEFVIDAPNTARLGLNFLNNLNNGMTPVVPTGGNPGVQMVELTAQNLQYIADALTVNFQIGNKQVAQAANQANLVAAGRGANG